MLFNFNHNPIFALALLIGVSLSVSAQFIHPFRLSTVNGNNGFVIHGDKAGDRAGASISSAGDINGDGLDDIIIGAYKADPNGNVNAGSSYVIFGTSSGLPNPFNLNSINGTNGFVIHGENAGDYSGVFVSCAGDINNDGIDDLIIGANGGDPNDNQDAGTSYVVFGSTSNLPNPLNLSSLNGSNGFAIYGINAYDLSASAVSSAGDINGDGIDDIVIGAFRAGPSNIDRSGRSYVVFGQSTGFVHPLNLSSLDGLNGFEVRGDRSQDTSGRSVSSAGDINGDGIDDLLIGADFSKANGISAAGRAYVIFGTTSGFPNPFNLRDVNDSDAIIVNGDISLGLLGGSVSAAGDINGDGIDDILIGASGTNQGEDSEGKGGAGSTYVVYGSTTGLASPLEVGDLNGSNGFVIDGEVADDNSGVSVSSGGDINGDGIDDLLVGAFRSNGEIGSTYVVFGNPTGLPNPLNLSSLNGINGFAIDGVNIGDYTGGSVDSAGDINNDGFDDVLIGAFGASPNGKRFAGIGYVIFGNAGNLNDLIFKNNFENQTITANLRK